MIVEAARLNVDEKSPLEGNATWMFAGWINPDTFNSSRDTWLMYKQTVLQWGMLSGGSRQMSVNIGGGGNNSLQGAVTNSTLLNSNTWTHVAVTYSNSTVKFYVNGLLTDTISKTYAMGSNNRAFSISTATQSFDGRLDDLRYYNRALSDTEIADVYGLRVTNPGFHLADALGSIIALTDTGKVIRTEYDYEPFGATTTTGAGNKNSYKFTAREDDGTGLYYYRARYYHPALGRFLSEDPIEYTGGDINLYAYVGNKPIMHSDPGGLRLRVCLTPTAGDFFTHKYLYWDSGPSELRRCERQDISPGMANNTDTGRPVGSRDLCKDVDDTHAMEIMMCCRKTAHNRPWFPFATDCHNIVDDCLNKFGVAPPDLGSHPRFGGRRNNPDKCERPPTCNFGP